MNMQAKPLAQKWSETLTEKRARVRTQEKGLWEAYSLELLSPEQMKAELRKLVTEQTKQVGLEAYE